MGRRIVDDRSLVSARTSACCIAQRRASQAHARCSGLRAICRSGLCNAHRNRLANLQQSEFEDCISRAFSLLPKLSTAGNVHLLAATRTIRIFVAAPLFFWGDSMLKIRRKKLSVAVVNALNAGVVVGLAAPLGLRAADPAAERRDRPGPEDREDRGHGLAHSVADAHERKPGQRDQRPGHQVHGLHDRRRTSSTSCRRRSPSQGSNLANGSTGTATINLRGLGPPRTLVLIDGKRVPAGSPISGWVADRHQRHSGAADPARRSADGRCVVDLRFGRRRRRGQLHHE